MELVKRNRRSPTGPRTGLTGVGERVPGAISVVGLNAVLWFALLLLPEAG
jgi:hypothetical protein